MDRIERLAAARLIDWRFLLPTPHLGRVGLVGAFDEETEAAVAAGALEVHRGRPARDPGEERWDVALLDFASVSSRATIEEVATWLRPGGWLLADLGRRSRVGGALRAAERALTRARMDLVARHWYLPDRRSALRIVSLDDAQAVRVILERHSERLRRRAALGGARALVRAGLPADLLGGSIGIMAHRPGGPSTGGWPSLEPLTAMLAGELGYPRPSWALLTPRFSASAHVVLLLIDDGEARHVAKLARLTGDDGPTHEGRLLLSLAAAGMPSGGAPTVVASTEIAGHAALVESALAGRPLDRARVRRDPRRWIGAASRWVERLPRLTGDVADLESLVRRPLNAVSSAIPSTGAHASLVARTARAVQALDGIALPAVVEHGDLSHPNVLVRDDGELGVLDWERARPDGLILNDLCFFLGYVALATAGEGVNPMDGFDRVLAEGSWGAVQALRAEADRYRVDRDLLPSLVIACWLRAFAGHLGEAPGASGSGWSGSGSASRYYRMWEGAVDRQEQLRNRLV
jgi:hypothetical protein